MAVDSRLEENNVDHFLISTRENQLLLVFIDQVEAMKSSKEAVNIWED